MEEYGYTTLRGCLKRVVPGIVCHQEAAKTLNFENISLQSRHNLRRSLAFQTPSQEISRQEDSSFNSVTVAAVGWALPTIGETLFEKPPQLNEMTRCCS